MPVYTSLRRLYTLDTLDARFTASRRQQVFSDDVTKASGKTSVIGPRGGAGSGVDKTSPSRWNTWEYYFYYFIFITIVPLMFKVPYDVSKASDPGYPKFAALLSPGWIAGRMVDNSDQQYASFRDNIPYMALLLLLHPLLRKAHDLWRPLQQEGREKAEALGEARLKQRLRFDVGFALVFITVLHGTSAAKVLTILGINYVLAALAPRPVLPIATWTFNLAVLFANELYRGYPFAAALTGLGFANNNSADGPRTLHDWSARLDAWSGVIPRWEILFNITVLRLISFNMDYYWSQSGKGDTTSVKQPEGQDTSERNRINVPAPSATFNFPQYLAYILYPPLYLAGPIITFNDYISQVRHPLSTTTTDRFVLYGLRFLMALLSMELILHFIYAVAISKSNPDWDRYTPFQLSMLGYFNLHIIWLKLLLPWRFFRLWSIVDGVDPPENMVRCMSNNYSALAFWRGWHRSFNRWIVRYIYIPLGGSGRGTSVARSLFNLGAVFTFVALWHDISLRLLTWSWLIVLFILPELVCSTVLFPAKAYKDRPNTYRLLAGVGAVGNVLMMMAANLVGFAVGLDGLKGLVWGLLAGWEGFAFLLAACAVLFVGVMVMFEIREEEQRQGFDMKC